MMFRKIAGPMRIDCVGSSYQIYQIPGHPGGRAAKVAQYSVVVLGSDNLAAIADFLTLSVPERHSDVVVMSICGGDKGGGESFEYPDGGVGDGSCEGATVGDVCVRFSDAEGAEFYDSGPARRAVQGASPRVVTAHTTFYRADATM
jgi:hypothetical protein